MSERSRAFLKIAAFIAVVLVAYLGFIELTDSERDQPHRQSEVETLFEKKSRAMGIVIGTPADDVLAIRGKPPYPNEVVGRDDNGLIVEWEYPDGIYVMRRWTIAGVTCYRVAEMKLGP